MARIQHLQHHSYDHFIIHVLISANLRQKSTPLDAPTLDNKKDEFMIDQRNTIRLTNIPLSKVT